MRVSDRLPLDRKRLLITVVVATLNEEAHIGGVLEDMLSQERLDADVEVLVVDGGSTDKTRNIVTAYASTGRVRLLDNPKRHQVYAYNIGVSEARGSIICIVGGHARFPRTYLGACLDAKRRTGAANVGGVVRHCGNGPVGEAIALAMSSPLGVGDSKYRHATREQYCDSVMGTFIDRHMFDEIGLFNESNIANQDGEFNYRLRAAGYGVLVSPSIECSYVVRSSFGKLASQYYRYGFYRRWTEVQHPRSVPWRVYAPPLLVGGLAFSGALGLAGRGAICLVVPAAYGLILAAAFLDGLRRSRRPLIALLEPVAIATMHLAFGVGWLRGLLAHRRPRGSP